MCLDANEDVYKKSIGKALTAVDRLLMVKVAGEFTGKLIGPTYFCRSKSIDSVWVTSDIQVVGASFMPASYSIGDHHLFAVDFLSSFLLGLAPKMIVQPQARRLNCKLKQSIKKYNARLEKKIIKHRLIEHKGRVYAARLSSIEAKQQMDIIDAKSKQYMKSAEKKCHKIKSGRIPYSPKSARWIRRLQVY